MLFDETTIGPGDLDAQVAGGDVWTLVLRAHPRDPAGSLGLRVQPLDPEMVDSTIPPRG